MAKSAQVDNLTLVPWVGWSQGTLSPEFSLDEKQLIQLPIESRSNVISQLLYSSSELVNKWVNIDRIVDVVISPKTFSWIDEEVTNSVTNGSLTSAAFWVNSVSRSTSVNTEVINASKTVPNFNLRVTCPVGSFNPSEQVEITITNTNVVRTATCMNNGGLDVTVSVGGFLSGVNSVVVKSLSKTGSNGRGIDRLTTIPLRRTTTNITTITNIFVPPASSDPISQSFVPPNDDIFVDSFSVIFDLYDIDGQPSALGSTITFEDDVFLWLMETTAGMPDIDKTIYKVKLPAGTKVNNNVFKEIILPDSILLLSNKEYAFVIGTDNMYLRVRQAVLGEKDITSRVWISNQPYPAGNMFTSSNRRNWSVSQNADLAFIIKKSKFQLSKDYLFSVKDSNTNNIMNIVNMTDMMLSVSEVMNNQYSSIVYVMEFTETDGSVFTRIINPNVIEQFDKPLTGTMKIKIGMSSVNSGFSPSILKDIQVSIGSSIQDNALISKSIYITENLGFVGNNKKLVMYLDILQGNRDDLELWYTSSNSGQDKLANWTKLTLTNGFNSNEVKAESGSINLNANPYQRVMVVLKQDKTLSRKRIAVDNLRVLVKD